MLIFVMVRCFSMVTYLMIHQGFQLVCIDTCVCFYVLSLNFQNEHSIVIFLVLLITSSILNALSSPLDLK